MNVTALDAQSIQVFREFLSHAFGQRRDQDPFVFSQGFPNFYDEVVHLMVARPDFNGGVKESCRPNDLLDHDSFGTLQLKIGRGGADVDGLVDDAVEFVMGERTVVQSRRESETVVNQRDLPRPVATKHGSNLWHRHVALVNDHQEILGEVVEQAKRPFSWLSSVEIPGIILNPRVKPDFLDHFQIVEGSLIETLGFEKARLLIEKRLLLLQVLLDFPNGGVGGLLAADKQVCRVNRELVKPMQMLPTLRIDGGQPLDFIVPKLHPNSVIGVGQMNVHRVSFHPEVPPFEIGDGPAVQACHQTVEQVVSGDALPHLQLDDVFVKLHRVANAVDARDACHDNHVSASTQQGGRGGQSKLFDFVIDLEVLLDVRVRRRNERLWLVIVVVTDKILHQVVGEEPFELTVQLCSEGFVVAQNQSGTLGFSDDIGHRERLSRTGHAEENLMG